MHGSTGRTGGDVAKKREQKNRRVLVVAAHPDDEVLGCGGTMARHAADGDVVSVVILGEGLTSRDEQRHAQRRAKPLETLRGHAIKAGRVMGVADVRFESLPDNRFDSLDLLDVVKRVEAVKTRVRPHIVYTHHPGDMNVDHRVTHQAVLTAFRAQPGEIVEAIYAFETLSSTEWQGTDWGMPFLPSHFVDITNYLDIKRRALACYPGELRPYPHPRSLKAVELFARAMGSQIGAGAAERFRTVRTIRRDK